MEQNKKIKLEKIETTRTDNLYILNRLINKIWKYEPGIINIIKFFLHPRDDEYKFQIGEIGKQIYYEMSYHSHFTTDLNCGMNINMYCECYFNRKHKNPSDLKKHKCIKLLRIEKLEYDDKTFKKKYICSYGYNFNYNAIYYEDEIMKLSDI